MRKLESTIAQFVSDLLQTIGEATVDDLRELFAGAPQGEKLFESLDKAPALPGPAVRLIAPPRAIQSERRAPDAPPRRSFGSRFTISSGPSLPPGVAEITDPESLLSLGGPSDASGSSSSSVAHRASLSNGTPPAERSLSSFAAPTRAPSRARAQALLDFDGTRERATPTDPHMDRHPELEGESPVSGIRPAGTGSTVRLSDNETLARVSNSGVVIRRKKRA
jgi:hypothetical protein